MMQRLTHARRVEGIHTGFQLLKNRKTMWCMLKATWKGQYKMSMFTKMLLILGSLYIVLPFDFDWIPLLGWVDDIAVFIFMIKRLQQEATRYVRAKVMERKGI